MTTIIKLYKPLNLSKITLPKPQCAVLPWSTQWSVAVSNRVQVCPRIQELLWFITVSIWHYSNSDWCNCFSELHPEGIKVRCTLLFCNWTYTFALEQDGISTGGNISLDRCNKDVYVCVCICKVHFYNSEPINTQRVYTSMAAL